MPTLVRNDTDTPSRCAAASWRGQAPSPSEGGPLPLAAGLLPRPMSLTPDTATRGWVPCVWPVALCGQCTVEY